MTRRLKPLAAGLTAAVLALSLVPASANKTTYLDVSDEQWYAVPIAFCQQHGLMEGPDRESFLPQELLTRGALTQSLYLLAGAPETDGELPFSDIAPDSPVLPALRWAAANGVVSGYPDGTFRPDDHVTREELAVLLWNSRDRELPAAAEAYVDQEDISPWALEAVSWARGRGVMSGGPDNCFYPKSNTTRAEGAALIMNCAQAFYGLQYGYTLPQPQAVPANPYNSQAYLLDENGYLSYRDGWYARGVDVSAHQEQIDWARVAGTGMDFAMIRAGYRGYTRGSIQKDPYFDDNMRGALANGLEVGAYFFSQALTPAEAEEEAYALLEWVRDYSITYPLVFDWEEVDKEDSRSRNTDGNTVTACALAFCRVIRDAGYTPMTYGSPSKIYAGNLALDYLQEYPSFWLAHYTKETAPTSFRHRYDIWQYSSSGQVDGIEGRVDLNLCLTDWSGKGNQGGQEEIPGWLKVYWELSATKN